MNRKVVTRECCYICGNDSEFSLPDEYSLLREATCAHCGATIRNSDTARIVARTLSGIDQPLADCIDRAREKGTRILEAAACGPLHRLLRELPNYVCFEYIEGTQPGETRDGILCNDLTRLSFADKSFDIVISQDVMEHIEDVDSALAEINRVLTNRGSHIFTVPIHEGKATATRREKRSVFHGDPLRQDGALVHVDWGSDINRVIDRFGYQTECYLLHRFHADSEITDADQQYSDYLRLPAQEFFRYNSNVIRSVKVRDYLPQVRGNHLQLLSFGPEVIQAEQPFNVQPGGISALWSHGENVTATTVLVVDGVRLQSVAQPHNNLVTATVPAWLTSVPGELEVWWEDPLDGKRSRSLRLRILPKPEGHGQTGTMELRRRIQQLERKIHDPQRQITPSFEGWGMATDHAVPWDDAQDWAHFRKAAEDVKRCFNFGLASGIGISRGNVDGLLWRHWNVAFAVRHALRRNAHPTGQPVALVECGVGDGMSAFFMLRELAEFKRRAISPPPTVEVILYDAWNLLTDRAEESPADRQLSTIYAANSMKRAAANLAGEGEAVKFIPGLLPDVLARHPTPKNIAFLHVDLNSAKATEGVLEHCLPRLATQAVVLFDDYGWHHYRETKEKIDLFLVRQPGSLLKLPTGQAIYFSP